MKPSDVILLEEPKLSLADQFYLPQVLIGLGTTWKHMWNVVVNGVDRVKCVACFMCSTACPARCIHIEADEAPWPDREKYPAKFDIDELRCIYCGMCEEACPVDAIELTSTYDIVGLTRQEMIFDKSKLLKMYDQTVGAEPM